MVVSRQDQLSRFLPTGGHRVTADGQPAEPSQSVASRQMLVIGGQATGGLVEESVVSRQVATQHNVKVKKYFQKLLRLFSVEPCRTLKITPREQIELDELKMM